MRKELIHWNFLLICFVGTFPSIILAKKALTVIGDQNADGEGMEELPDYWEQETDPEAIKKVRQKLMDEVLGQKKFTKMREALAEMSENNASIGLNQEPTPDNILMEVKLMEQVNLISNDDPNAVPSHKVPTAHRINDHIQDLLYGGDMLLRDDQADDTFPEILADKTNTAEFLHGQKQRSKRQVIKGSMFPLNQWAISQPICYTFDASITENTRRLVRLGTQFWQNNTCVNFKEDCSWTPQVRVFKGTGCYSEVGRDFMSHEQKVSLGSGCEIFGTVTHEFGHVLGFYHHMSRTDRDENINIIQENIEPSWRSQYTKAPSDRVDNEGTTYEYASVMHYGGTGTESEKIIMAAKHKRYQHTMGRNVSPTFQDLLAINKYYGCLDQCKTGADCQHKGFRNSRNCQKCICPEGFGGDDCSQLAPGQNGAPADCGDAVAAGDDPKVLTGSVSPKLDPGRLLSDRAAGCHWQIIAPNEKRVKMVVNSLNGTCTPECFFGAVEIKVGDLAKGGIRICCEKHMAEIGEKLISDSQMVIISVYSQRGDRSFNITYQATDDPSNGNDDLLGNSASLTSTNSYTSLFSVLGLFSQNRNSCKDTNTICQTPVGKMMCKVPGYEDMCKKTCKKC